MSQRVTWADAARGIAILLVVLGHTCPPDVPTALIYTFHMPLFFILSGMFFRADEPFASFMRKKVRTLLVPFVVFNLVLLASDWCIVALSPNYHEPVSIPSRLLGTLFAMRHGSWSSSLWFLPCLFVAQMLLALCHGASHSSRKAYLVGCAALTAAGLAYNLCGGPSLPFSADVALLASGFVVLGNELQPANHSFSSWPVWSLMLLLYLSAALFNHHWLGSGSVHVDMSDSILGCWPVFYVGALAGSAVVIGLCQRFQMPTILASAGRHSLVIYCLHRIPLNLGIALTNLIPWLNEPSFACQSIRSIVLVGFTCVLLWPATWMVNRWMPWTLGKPGRSNHS